MGPPESKSLEIDTVPQNKLNVIKKKREIWLNFQNNGSRVLWG